MSDQNQPVETTETTEETVETTETTEVTQPQENAPAENGEQDTSQ